MFGNDTAIYRFQGPFGVPVEIGASLLFLAFIFFGLDLSSPQVVLHGVVSFVMVLVSIFLHELGHAWAAKVQGVTVRKVMLYGGGGYCEHESTTPYQSEFIVLMGPLVNLALWAVSSLAAYWVFNSAMHGAAVGPVDSSALQVQMVLTYWLQVFAWINLFLFAMNMVPVQPLDGGQLLHLALLRILPADAAVRIAGAVGVVFALLWLPAMVWLLFTVGWALLFVPSIWVHWCMLTGKIHAS